MDVISNRQLLVRVRKYVRMVPFTWSAYLAYWQLRVGVERRRRYFLSQELVDFGAFPQPTLEDPVSQLCTANQLLSPVFRNWCRDMHSPARFSRKQWEFAYILQALKLTGVLRPGMSGVGFGCGREPLAGLIAQHGCRVLATDLEQQQAAEQGWVDTMQHVSSLEGLYTAAEKFISRENFDDRVQFRSVNMNEIPDDLEGKFDFTWSACALEHLGSLKHGLDFIKHSVDCLKPGGVAVHTTEFNLSSNDDTCEHPSCSIYRACDIRQLIGELEASGFIVAPLNLNTGESQVDNHIDAPPYSMSPHLKLLISGYAVTSIGIIVKRPA